MAKRKLVDWESVEPLYRAGILSNYEISEQYARDHLHSQTWKQTVAESAIRKQAKAKEWKKSLSNKVKEQIKENLVRNEVRDAHQTLSDQEIVEKAAEVPTKVRLLQRTRAQAMAEVGDKLLKAVLSGTGKTIPKKNLPGLIKMYRDLVQSRGKLQLMESDAFNLGDEKHSELRWEDRLMNI
jgi:hypothetical protein